MLQGEELYLNVVLLVKIIINCKINHVDLCGVKASLGLDSKDTKFCHLVYPRSLLLYVITPVFQTLRTKISMRKLSYSSMSSSTCIGIIVIDSDN